MSGLAVVLVFSTSAMVIAFAGTAMARTADTLSERTGLGHALFGAIFLGGVTSLPGVVTSVSAAWSGFPELALANAVGGIAAQTAFLAVADVAHPRANLEHAAASLGNMISAVLLIALLTIPLFAAAMPEVNVLGVHPASVLILVAYVLGMRLVRAARTTPGWRPRLTEETERDERAGDARSSQRKSLSALWLRFGVLSALVGGAGYAVAQSGIALAERLQLSETAVGALLTAVVTSLPELVTAVAAVRRGALRLAVGDILGGNCFDILFISAADVAYRPGSILHAASPQVFLISLNILLTAILMLGLLHREKHGIANIGFESFLVLLIYLGSVLFLALG